MSKGNFSLNSDFSRTPVQQAYLITEGGAIKWEFEACKDAPKLRQEKGVWLTGQ